MYEKEYIERDAVIRAIIGQPPEPHYPDWYYRDIKEIPTADVVEVVRCKDCKHYEPYEGEEHKGDCAELVGLESCVYKDDFCSYGERKEQQ